VIELDGLSATLRLSEIPHEQFFFHVSPIIDNDQQNELGCCRLSAIHIYFIQFDSQFDKGDISIDNIFFREICGFYNT
jgi:hypothetical protein